MQSILERLKPLSPSLHPEIIVPGSVVPAKPPAPERPHHSAVSMVAQPNIPAQSMPNHKALEATYRGTPS